MSPAGPGYSGPGASPTQAAGEPFAADSPYFPFGARPSSRLSPAKTKVTTTLRTKDEPQTSVSIDNQQWVVSYCLIEIVSFSRLVTNFNKISFIVSRFPSFPLTLLT